MDVLALILINIELQCFIKIYIDFNKTIETESFLSKILECEANTSNTIKYLELGIYPIRFELMKRKILLILLLIATLIVLNPV